MIVIADDITGAAEMAGMMTHRPAFVVIGVQTTTDGLWQSLKERLLTESQMVIATDTRSMKEADAMALIQAIRQALPRDARLFKKTDSVLRGHVVAELQALMQGRYRKALLLPANPSKRRIIRDRQYLIDGVPLHLTSFRNDPEYPAYTADVTRLLPGVHYVTPHDTQLPDGINIGEVTCRDDIAYYVRQFPDVLLAGGADCLSVVQGEEEAMPSDVPCRMGQRICLVMGSTIRHDIFHCSFFHHHAITLCPMPDEVFDGHPSTAWAEVPGNCCLYMSQQRQGQATWLKNIMAQAVCHRLKQYPADELIIEGGATAFGILRQLQWTDFTVAGQIAPGVVRLLHTGSGTHVWLKPGSYPWNEIMKCQ